MTMSFDDDISNTCLQLGLGLHNLSENCMKRKKKKEDEPSKLCNNKVYPSLTLGRIDDDGEEEDANDQLQASKIIEASNSPSEVSSFSNSSSIIKKDRDQCLGEEFHEARDHDHVDEDHGNPRKKLRLTTEQSAVLEENFKENSTLNPKQKQELATKLNLRARQVEVWFQNRRARTKLKQTESDCELLKKCCETLTEENNRLQKELQQLKSMQPTPAGPFYMQTNPSATLTICPSCERIFGGGSNNNNNMMLDHHHHHHHHLTHFYENNNIHSTKHHRHHHPQHAR